MLDEKEKKIFFRVKQTSPQLLAASPFTNYANSVSLLPLTFTY